MRTICSKVLLQMNCKLGGELWGCNVPIDSLMVIGMDVYRDKVGGRSVAGIVTTLNGSFGKYWSQVRDCRKETLLNMYCIVILVAAKHTTI